MVLIPKARTLTPPVRLLLAPALVGVATVLLAVATRPAPAGAPGRISVVAGFAPLADAAREVGGRRVRVEDLTPAGAEPHDLELTSDAVDSLLDADLALVLGHDFQPAVEHAAADRSGPTLRALDVVSRGRRADDPHVWLDPVRYRAIVAAVARRLEHADPAHAREYRPNAARIDAELQALDARYRAGLASCTSRALVTAHEAFGFLAERYGLVQHGVAGIDPEAEPDPDTLARLADLVRREGVRTVFTERLGSPRVARTLAREAGGIRTAVLDPLESPRRGTGYVAAMDANLARLRAALGCR
jgi:zinc transport system substrate-binding protein